MTTSSTHCVSEEPFFEMLQILGAEIVWAIEQGYLECARVWLVDYTELFVARVIFHGACVHPQQLRYQYNLAMSSLWIVGPVSPTSS